MHTAVIAGVEMSEAARDAEFSAYMAARQPALLRTAFLLTGDLAAAEDLVQNAFAKLYLCWDKVQSRESLDGYVRRIMVNENNSLWRRAWKRTEVTTAALPERPVSDEYDEGRVAAVWELVRTPAPQATRGDRAALLRTPVGGRDRRHARRLHRDREVPGQPRAGSTA